MGKFSNLGLSDTVLKAVDRLGYTTPTPVQSKTIPLVLEGSDVIAAAETGTGKTAAFALPALDKLPRNASSKCPHMLVITPTRELASQIADVCTQVAKSTGHHLASVVGGVGITPQIQQLENGVDVLVATPGRLIDLMEQKAVDLSCVQILVLDEADRMLDMGFLPSVTKIVKAIPTKRQTLLFSATLDDSILDQVSSMLHNPQFVQIAAKGDTAETIDQYIIQIPHALKCALLIALLRERGSKRVLVFARTRHRVDTACRKLRRAGFSVAAIHSDRSQSQRQHALDEFAEGSIDVLVATDVLARGIDVADITYVVNYDLPSQAEDYVHRIGRTGRAGAAGCAISFVSPENADDLKAIEKLTRHTIPETHVKGFDLEAEKAKAASKAAGRHDAETAKTGHETAQQESSGKASQGKAKAKTSQGKASQGKEAKGSGKGSSSTKANKKPPTQSPRTERTDSSHSPANRSKNRSGKTSGQRSKTGSRTSRSSSGNCTRVSTAQGDMRPGRAHRASVARKRRRRRKDR